MPLLTKPSRYYDYDLIVVSQIPFTFHVEGACLSLYLGHYHQYREHPPYVEPFCKLVCWPDGRQDLRDVYDGSVLEIGTTEEDENTLEGVVLGALNESDTYAARQYLRLLVPKLWPVYRARVRERALRYIP